MTQIFGTVSMFRQRGSDPLLNSEIPFMWLTYKPEGSPYTFLLTGTQYSFYECGSMTEINGCIDGWQIAIKCLSTEDTELYKYGTTPRMKFCNSLLEDKVQGFSSMQFEARQHNGTLLVDNEQKRAVKLLTHHYSSPILNLCHLPPVSPTWVKTEFKTIKLK